MISDLIDDCAKAIHVLVQRSRSDTWHDILTTIDIAT